MTDYLKQFVIDITQEDINIFMGQYGEQLLQSENFSVRPNHSLIGVQHSREDRDKFLDQYHALDAATAAEFNEWAQITNAAIRIGTRTDKDRIDRD